MSSSVSEVKTPGRVLLTIFILPCVTEESSLLEMIKNLREGMKFPVNFFKQYKIQGFQ
jgi:hypothetical protein